VGPAPGDQALAERAVPPLAVSGTLGVKFRSRSRWCVRRGRVCENSRPSRHGSIGSRQWADCHPPRHRRRRRGRRLHAVRSPGEEHGVM